MAYAKLNLNRSIKKPFYGEGTFTGKIIGLEPSRAKDASKARGVWFLQISIDNRDDVMISNKWTCRESDSAQQQDKTTYALSQLVRNLMDVSHVEYSDADFNGKTFPEIVEMFDTKHLNGLRVKFHQSATAGNNDGIVLNKLTFESID